MMLTGAKTSRKDRGLLLRALACASLALACGMAWGAPRLSVEEIVERNIAARGGLQAWRNVQSMSVSGEMDAGRVRPFNGNAVTEVRRGRPHIRNMRVEVRHGKANPPPVSDEGKMVQLPYTMELKRPRKMRLELQFDGKTALQVYDGGKGWKLRPYLGKNEAEPFTAEEMHLAAQQQELDGFLIDHAAKGTKVELEGQEQVEGNDTYKLKLTLKDGEVRRLWVDAKTFLETRVDGTRRMDGRPRTMMTYFLDYKPVDGLMMPHVLETRVDGVRDAERIIVERVALNPALDDARFSQP